MQSTITLNSPHALRSSLAFLLIMTIGLFASVSHALSFEQAKQLSKERVYYDRSTVGDAYCGCTWEWLGRSGGRINPESCGLKPRKQPDRSVRLEHEHIVPAENLGRQRQCWQEGGRENCVANDPVFGVMYTDLHNLTPVPGEINGDRSNFNFTDMGQRPTQYGSCDFVVDFSQRAAQPSERSRGQIARTYMYMHDRYNLSMSRQQEQLFIAWNNMYPVSQWELERNRRIASVTGVSNDFVTGNQVWTRGFRPRALGLQATTQSQQQSRVSEPVAINAPIRGNKNSKIYHLPAGCPSYNSMAERNIVEFSTETEAESAGYRKAKNCQ